MTIMHFIRRAVAIFFFLIGFVLLVIGLAAFGGAFVKSGDVVDGFTWKPLADLVDNGSLVPASTLLTLAGVTAEDALNNALENADFESAFALVAYDPRLSDQSRVGALLQLGNRFATGKNTRKAGWCFEAAAVLATLSPSMSDLSRIDAYLQANAGLRSVNAFEAARRAADQAYLVAQFSSTLRGSQRAGRLSQIANAYSGLGAEELAVQVRAKADSARGTTETQTATSRTPFIPFPGQLPPVPEVENAKKTRIAAAKELLDDVIANSPKTSADWHPDLVKQLGDALVQEDSARFALYDLQLPQSKDAPTQFALQYEKAQWLAIKYRVARGAFGANLVPEWSKDTTAISDALSDAWGDLFASFESQASARANAQEANQATEDVLKQELIVLRWGWNRKASEKDMRPALEDATQKLRDASVAGLRLSWVVRSGKIMYLLVPDDLYGQNEQALPK